jgi:hypothetical protein
MNDKTSDTITTITTTAGPDSANVVDMDSRHPPAGVALDKPIQRGEQTITHVALRRPLAGELRGINLAALIREMDYGALEALLPRVSTPTLTRADVAGLDPADLAALATEVILFFVSKAAMAELSPNA